MKKQLTNVVIKDADQGLVEAVFSRFGVVDADGDITDPGAFTEGAAVVISAYGHKSWEGQLPVGKGTIHEDGATAILRGQFLLNTTHGRDTFETVKALSEAGLQEWSYSLHDVVAEPAVVEGRKVRRIKKVGLVKEVSPVLRGAGVNTATLAVKSDRKQLVSTLRALLSEAGHERWPDADWVWLLDVDIDESWCVFAVETYDEQADTYTVSYWQVGFDRADTAVVLATDALEVVPASAFLPKGTRFADTTDSALRAVKACVDLAVERLALRAADGKSVTEQIDAHDRLIAAVAPLKSAIDATSHPHINADDLRREFARFVAITREVHTS
jgi:hypothetical protein